MKELQKEFIDLLKKLNGAVLTFNQLRNYFGFDEVELKDHFKEWYICTVSPKYYKNNNIDITFPEDVEMEIEHIKTEKTDKIYIDPITLEEKSIYIKFYKISFDIEAIIKRIISKKLSKILKVNDAIEELQKGIKNFSPTFREIKTISNYPLCYNNKFNELEILSKNVKETIIFTKDIINEYYSKNLISKSLSNYLYYYFKYVSPIAIVVYEDQKRYKNYIESNCKQQERLKRLLPQYEIELKETKELLDYYNSQK